MRCMALLCALSLLLVASALVAPAAQATFPGRNGPVLAGGSTGDFEDCWSKRRPRPAARIADPDGPSCEPSDPEPPDALFLYGLRSRRLARFAPDAQVAAFSPSGTRLAVVADRGLRLLDMASGGRGRLIRKGVRDVAWTPSGRLVAVSDANDPGTLLDLSAAGRGRVLRRGAQPDVSVTGRIAYVDTNDRLSIMRADGSRPRNVVPSARWTASSPSWSPDGRRLAFVRLEADGERGAIWVVRSDGKGLRRITSYRYDGTFLNPKWAPDGGTIAFGYDDGWGADVRVVPPNPRGPLGQPQWRRVLDWAWLKDWQPLP